MAEETRRKVYDMLVAEKMLVRLPLSVSGHGLYREGGHGLSGNSGDVEPDALIGNNSQHGEGRHAVAAFFVFQSTPRTRCCG